MTGRLRGDEPFLLSSWEIHPSLNQMVNGSEARKLRPQVMDLLIYLVRRRGEVVSSDEMLEELWSGKVVSSASIYGTIAQLRRALGQTQDIRVETIPRRGYRLVAPAPRRLPDSATGISQGRREQTEPDRLDDKVSHQPRRVSYGVGVALLIGIALGAGLIWTSFRTTFDVPNEADPVDSDSVPTAEDAVPTIAVLPFQNMTAAEENSVFADGVHEEILTQLSRLPAIDIISRTSVMRFTNDRPSASEIARMLSATHLVEGSVRRAGNTVRITVQLIDSSSDKHLWAETYDREVADVFAVQTDVAVRVATALNVAFSPTYLSQFDDTGTDSLEAYDLYLRARRIPNYNPIERLAQQVDFLRDALEIDPNYAAAWQLLARAESWPSHRGTDMHGDHLRRAEEALRQARRLAPDSTDTMSAEAAVLYWGKQEFEAALARIRAARTVEPRRAEFIEFEAWILRRLGRFDEFVDLWSRASRLDPLNADRARSLGDEATMISRYGEALEAFLRAYRASPTEDAGDKYGVEVARVLASPDYGTWRRIQDEVLTALGDNPLELRETWFGELFIEQLYLTGQREKAWPLLGRPDGEVVSEDFYCVNSAYWEVAALSFLGEKQAALELGKKVLPATLEWEQHHEQVWNRSLSAIHKTRLGILLGRNDLVEDGLAYLQQKMDSPRDAYWHRLSTYFYLEGLVASDPARAQQIFLNGNSQVIPLHHFGLRPHIWYPLLDSPDVRALLDDHPKWVQFMRDRWPESREFPFD